MQRTDHVETNRKRKAASRQSERESIRRKKNKAKSTSELKCTQVSLDEHDVHIFLWMKKISIDRKIWLSTPRSLFSRRQKKSLSSHLLPNYLVTKQYNVPIFSDSFFKFLTVFLYTCLRFVSFSKKCERTCAAKIRYPCFFTEF